MSAAYLQERNKGPQSSELLVMIGIRTVILLSTLVATVAANGDLNYIEKQRVNWLYGAISLLLTFCLLSSLWLRRHTAGKYFAYTQLCVDAGLITGIVYISGALISPFLFLYLPLVMGAAIILSRSAALIMTLLCSVIYGLFSLSLLKGWIPLADGSTYLQLPTSGLPLQITGLSSGMLLVAVLSALLITRLRSSYSLIEQSRHDISKLNNQQRELINGIPSGVIATQLDGTIISVNKAAEQLLDITEKQVTEQNITSLLGKLDSTIDVECLQNCFSLSRAELKLQLERDQQTQHIHFFGRPLRDQNEELAGYVFVFEDITKQRSIEEQLEIQDRMARLLAEQNQQENRGQLNSNEFVGESPIMQKLFRLIERVATSEATVLISGESGSGKELVAHSIHNQSSRRSGPFVAVNCGAIPENLIESELFGHKKGSFTGADSDHAGMFRRADQGTIFLDEIGELPLNMQAKLLRTIQERTVHPVGGDRDFPVNVRIVAASNKNLRQEVNSGAFREDLFYRLNVINIQMPPLRERREDIPLLVNHLLKKLSPGNSVPVVPPTTMQMLLSYDYPGNVRELENIIERAVVLGGDILLPEHLPNLSGKEMNGVALGIKKETDIIIDDNLVFPIDLDSYLAKIEQRYLEAALEKTNGAKKKAADLLGINFRSFRYRLQKFGLQDDPGN